MKAFWFWFFKPVGVALGYVFLFAILAGIWYIWKRFFKKS